MGKRPTLPRLQGLPRIDGKPRRRCPACGRFRPCRPCRPAVAVLPLPLCRPRLPLAVPLVITSAALCPAPPPAVPMPSAWPACRRAYIGPDIGPCRPAPGPARGKGLPPPYPVRLADVARGLPLPLVIPSAGCGASHVIKGGSNFLTDFH